MNKKIFITLLFSLLIFGFISCTENKPVINNGVLYLVFDYSDENSKGNPSLCTFVQVDNFNRVEYVGIHCEKSQLNWKTDKVFRYSDSSNKKWVGSYNFILPPKTETFVNGEYQVFLSSYSGEEEKFVSKIKCDEKFYEYTQNEVRNNLSKKNKAKIVLYSENNNVIYYNTIKNNWKTYDDIKKEYEKAFKLKICYTLSDSNVIFMMNERDLSNNLNESIVF